MPLILGTNSIKDTGYNVANSCRFDVASTDYLNISQSNGNRKTYTWSCWFKRSTLATFQLLWHCNNAGHYSYFGFDGDDKLIYYAMDGATNQGDFKSTRVFRDVSAWYHIVARIDTTESSSGDRLRFYINGEQITSWDTSSQPMSQNTDTEMNVSGHTFRISTYNNGSSWLGGYLAECVFIDGQSLAPTSFGEFDSDSPNIWKPIDVSDLTFGTNGFHLDFENASSLGADVSGNGNNFTVSNLTSIDQTTDTCTNNFATLNPFDKGYTGTITLSEGNLVTESSSGAGDYGLRSTIGVTTGKWYLEAKISTSNTLSIGDIDARLVFSMIDGSPPDDFYGVQRYSDTQTNIHDDGSYSQFNTSMWGGITSSDIISFAVDLDNNKIFLAKNGSFKNQSGNTGDPANGTNPTFTISDATKTYTFYTELRGNDADGTLVNFGNPPFTISSGNADANGFGNFEYAVPSGYFALCSKNLSEFG